MKKYLGIALISLAVLNITFFSTNSIRNDFKLSHFMKGSFANAEDGWITICCDPAPPYECCFMESGSPVDGNWDNQ
jgi:hypothetical protein